jgi:hypothetical protein
LLQSYPSSQQFDFWRIINWLFVSIYWTILADLGQAAPTIYFPTPQGPYNFSSATDYPTTNNIFVNTTLYDIYASYLENTILPLLNSPGQAIPPVTTGTPITLPTMTFIQSYSCTRRQLKKGISFLIAVVVADYALIIGGYSLAILIAGTIQKYRRRDGKFSFSAV